MGPDLDLDLSAAAGAFGLEVRAGIGLGPVALVGPNGAGKTTLLRVLAGGLRPQRGHAIVRGRVLFDTVAGTLHPPEDRRVGYLPQGHGLFAHLTALENVCYGMRHLPRGDRRARGQALLEERGVGALGPRRPARMSGGEQQRVALARALATSPDLLLLDEPTAALDVTVRRELRALLARQLHDPARVAVVVTHDLRDLLAWRPTVWLMEEGRVVEQGSVETLRARSTHPFLRELLAPFDLE